MIQKIYFFGRKIYSKPFEFLYYICYNNKYNLNIDLLGRSNPIRKSGGAMKNFFEEIVGWFGNVFRQFTMIGINDVIDILIVTVILYYAYKFIKDRRAGKLAGGIVLLAAFLILAEIFRLQTLKYIFVNIFQVGMIAIVIIFQPELRAALEKMGGESLRGLSGIKPRGVSADEDAVTQLCDAVFELASTKTGALIVLENTTRLGDIVKTGVTINADMNASLINNIFYNKAPLHDGAMIIRDYRILAAGCFLPLTENTELSKDLGTRHRAALGMSEASDAKVIVVSEETGVVSVAHNGVLRRRYDKKTLTNEISAFFTPATIEGKLKDNKIRKMIKFKKNNDE